MRRRDPIKRLKDDGATPADFGFDRPVTRDDLGRLGGNARFQPPASDRSQQIATGQRPTAQRSAPYPWWYFQ